MNKPDFESVIRPIPDDPKLAAAAKNAKAGSWVYQVDWSYPDTQRTPPEAIRGGWEVGEGGTLTGRFAANPRYRPIEQSSRPLRPYMYAGASAYPSHWIVEVDERGDAHFPNPPDEYVRGWWWVDDKGTLTSNFRPNSRWVPPMVHHRSD